MDRFVAGPGQAEPTKAELEEYHASEMAKAIIPQMGVYKLKLMTGKMPSKGVIPMQPDHIQQIKDGKKTLTTRSEEAAHGKNGFWKGDGVYSLPDGSLVRVTFSTNVTNTDPRINDGYARMEGYASLKEMKAKVMEPVKSFLNRKPLTGSVRTTPAQRQKAIADSLLPEAEAKVTELQERLYSGEPTAFELRGEVGADHGGVTIATARSLGDLSELPVHPMADLSAINKDWETQEFQKEVLAEAPALEEFTEAGMTLEEGVATGEAVEGDLEGTASERAMEEMSLQRAYEISGSQREGKSLLGQEMHEAGAIEELDYPTEGKSTGSLLTVAGMITKPHRYPLQEYEKKGAGGDPLWDSEKELMGDPQGKQPEDRPIIPMTFYRREGPKTRTTEEQAKLYPRGPKAGSVHFEPPSKEPSDVAMERAEKIRKDRRRFGWNPDTRKVNSPAQVEGVLPVRINDQEVEVPLRPKTPSEEHKRMRTMLEAGNQQLQKEVTAFDGLATTLLLGSDHFRDDAGNIKPQYRGVVANLEAGRPLNRSMRRLAVRLHGDKRISDLAGYSELFLDQTLTDWLRDVEAQQEAVNQIAHGIRLYELGEKNKGAYRAGLDMSLQNPIIGQEARRVQDSPWRGQYLVYSPPGAVRPEGTSLESIPHMRSIFGANGDIVVVLPGDNKATRISSAQVDMLPESAELAELQRVASNVGVGKFSKEEAQAMAEGGYILKPLDEATEADFRESQPLPGPEQFDPRVTPLSEEEAEELDGLVAQAQMVQATEENWEQLQQDKKRLEELSSRAQPEVKQLQNRTWFDGANVHSSNANREFFLRNPDKIDIWLHNQYGSLTSEERRNLHGVDIWTLGNAERHAWFIERLAVEAEMFSQHELRRWIGQNLHRFSGLSNAQLESLAAQAHLAVRGSVNNAGRAIKETPAPQESQLREIERGPITGLDEDAWLEKYEEGPPGWDEDGGFLEAPPLNKWIKGRLYAGPALGSPNYTWKSQAMEKIIDKDWPIEEWERWLEKHGVDIPKEARVKIRKELKRGNVDALQDELDRKFFRPFIDAIVNEDGKLGLGRHMTMEDVHHLLMSYSMKDRNKAQRPRQKTEAKGRPVYMYPGGIPDHEALARIEKLEKKYGVEHAHAVRDAAKDIAENTRKIWERDKRVHPDVIETLRERYKYYVPLRQHEMLDVARWGQEIGSGELQVETEKMTNMMNRMYYGTQRGIDMRIKPFRTALGLPNEADANSALLLMAQANLAVAQSVDVEIGYAVLDLIELGRQSTSTITGGQLTNIATIVPKGQKTTPQIVTTKDPETGKYNQEKMDVYDERFDDRDNVVVILDRDGVYQSVYFADEYRHLAMALKDDSVSNLTKSNTISFVSALTRYVAAMITRWNPAFSIPNFVRDTTTAAGHITAEYGPEVARDMFKPKMGKTIGLLMTMNRMRAQGKYDPESDEFKANPDWVMYDRYLKSGAPVTFLDLGQTRGLEEFFKEVEEYNNPSQIHQLRFWSGKVSQLRTWVENFNDAFENAARFSYFRYGAEVGLPSKLNPGENMDDMELGHGAKNLTVNFEKKGTAGQAFNGLYMFFNANVQSNVRLIEALFKTDKYGNKTFQPYAKQVIGGIIGFHAALAIMNAAMAGEDEDDGELFWNKVPDYEKRSNLIIMDFIGQSGKGLKVPLPYGYNIFAAIGSMIGELQAGTKSMDEAMPYLLETALGALSPVGGGTEFLDMITPTLMKPVVELSRNRDWKGSAIYKDRYGDATIPDSELAFDTTDETLVAATAWLNEVAGGNRFVGGEIAGFDASINPATLQHLLSLLGGGVVKDFFRGKESVQNLLTGEQVRMQDVPLARRFVTTVTEYAGTADFRERRDQITQVERMRKARLPLNDEQRRLLRLSSAKRHADSEIKKIRERMRRLPLGSARRKKEEEKEKTQQNIFNRRWIRLMETART